MRALVEQYAFTSGTEEKISHIEGAKTNQSSTHTRVSTPRPQTSGKYAKAYTPNTTLSCGPQTSRYPQARMLLRTFPKAGLRIVHKDCHRLPLDRST
jgi:hypothetical protein